MKKIFILIISMNLIHTLNTIAQEKGSFVDSRDNKTYKTVKLGKQSWMAENLNFKIEDNSVCYEDKQSNCDQYGLLYTWEAAKISCPNGWHLPSDGEWKTLEMALGMSLIEANKNVSDTINGPGRDADRGTNQGDQLKEKGTTHWAEGNKGTNTGGFNALPGGGADNSSSFYLLGKSGVWWTASIALPDTETILKRSLEYNSSKVNRGIYDNSGTFSVRCIKN